MVCGCLCCKGDLCLFSGQSKEVYAAWNDILGCSIYSIKSRCIGWDRTGERSTEAMVIVGLGLGCNVEGNAGRRQKDTDGVQCVIHGAEKFVAKERENCDDQIRGVQGRR